MKSRDGHGQAGFTLIELLVVVAVIGIIAAILIPNLVDAIHKAKQKSTVADIRNIGLAWMSWVTDQLSAGAAGQYVTGQLNWTEDLPEAVAASALDALLVGDLSQFYLQRLKTDDGWLNPLEFRAVFTAGSPTTYSALLATGHMIGIRSPGRDGSFDGTTYTSGTSSSASYDCDIVWSDGYFVRAPGPVKTATACDDGGTE